MTKPEWKPGHPTEDGLYWISVVPKIRPDASGTCVGALNGDLWYDTSTGNQPLPAVWLVEVKDGYGRTVAPGGGDYRIGAWDYEATMMHCVASVPSDPWTN